MEYWGFGWFLGRRLGGWGLLCIGLLFFTSSTLAVFPEGDGARTWRRLSELSEEELARLDLSSKTPRDPKIPYLPAEPYPFTPPYTAEEMGFRSMEFPHLPRWNCVQIEVGGSLTPSGYLFTLKTIVLVLYQSPEGLVGQIKTEPGGIYTRWLSQDTAPPESLGNQMLMIQRRTDKLSTTKADLFG